MPANPQVTDEMCIAAAQSDDEYDVTHLAALILPSTPNREDAGT